MFEYQYDKNKYKAYNSKHWMILHWKINPGMFINELILGQRLPKLSLVDKTSSKPLVERSYVPCPHCNTLHNSKTWSTQNNTAFKNWFGLYCPNCGEIIPCIFNYISLLILALTYPIWFSFKNKWKNKWSSKQPQRYKNLDLTSKPNPYDGWGWIRIGLGWGFAMFVFMSLLYPYFIDGDFRWLRVFIGIPVWTLGGLAFGYIMKIIMGKPGVKSI